MPSAPPRAAGPARRALLRRGGRPPRSAIPRHRRRRPQASGPRRSRRRARGRRSASAARGGRTNRTTDAFESPTSRSIRISWRPRSRALPTTRLALEGAVPGCVRWSAIRPVARSKAAACATRRGPATSPAVLPTDRRARGSLRSTAPEKESCARPSPDLCPAARARSKQRAPGHEGEPRGDRAQGRSDGGRARQSVPLSVGSSMRPMNKIDPVNRSRIRYTNGRSTSSLGGKLSAPPVAVAAAASVPSSSTLT